MAESSCMSRDILNGRDDHNTVFRRENLHFRRLQSLLDLLANKLLCSIDKVPVGNLSHSCTNYNIIKLKRIAIAKNMLRQE